MSTATGGSNPIVADLVIRHARHILTCAGPAPRAGPAQAVVSPIPDGALASRDGRIVFVGPAVECDRVVSLTLSGKALDASGCTVIPGFVDPHTHAVFAGDRREELRRRLAGATYAQIAAGGGGIVSTVRATRAADEADLVRLHDVPPGPE